MQKSSWVTVCGLVTGASRGQRLQPGRHRAVELLR